MSVKTPSSAISGHYSPLPQILVIDDDTDCLEEYGSTLESLGYRHLLAANGKEALHLLDADPSIGVIMTDVRMPGIDGISLLGEISARYGATRTLVSIVITGYGSLDMAVNAMRFDAVDFLCKPVSRDECGAALRRAYASWQKRTQATPEGQLARLGSEVARILQVLDAAPTQAHESLSATEAIELLNLVIKSRQNRIRHFGAELSSEPTWDILLDVALNHFGGTPVAVSSVCVSTSASLSTALRRVNMLVEAGLVIRWTDPDDRRRDLLDLTPQAHIKMLDYLRSLAMLISF